MILAHKMALDPNDVQETDFRKAVGAARFAYSWALDPWQQHPYAVWKPDPGVPKPLDATLRRQLNVRPAGRFSC